MVDAKSVMAVIRSGRPSFRNDIDKVAFAVHASFIAGGYFLTGTGSSASLSSTSSDEVGTENWNESEGDYTFVYINPNEKDDKMKKVIVKCLSMNHKLVVDAVGGGDSEPVHTELDVKEYVSGEEGTGNYAAQYNNFEKIVKKLGQDILAKLDASSLKPSSKFTGESRHGLIEPEHGDLHRPAGPFTDPQRFVIPPVNPIGGTDLFPGPPPGAYPIRGGYGPGGSMILGPNDPFWTDRSRSPGFPITPPGVPPGSRFDPIGPPDVPGFEPSRFRRFPRGPGGGTHPDLEHFRDYSDTI